MTFDPIESSVRGQAPGPKGRTFERETSATTAALFHHAAGSRTPGRRGRKLDRSGLSLAIELDLGGKAACRANEHFIHVSFALMRAIGLTHDNGIVE